MRHTPAPEAPPERDDDTDVTSSRGILGGVDEPDDSDLLRQWAEEDRLETLSPRRNWSPLIALVIVAAIVALMVFAVRFALDDDTDGAVGAPRGGDTETGSVLDEDAPTLDDLTAEVTIPPGPDTGLAVADKGVTIVEDRFDAARREGTFAAIIDNPNPDWIAQGVQVDVQFLDEAGTSVGGDSAFIELVLPSQRVAVASLFFDAPTVPVTDLAITVDVARWRESEPVAGGFTTADVATVEAEFSGVKTTFLLRSDFPEPLTDVGVTAVYRNALGFIVGGFDTFVDRLEPGVDTPVEIALLANVAVDQITSTELYPTASFGFTPDN